MADLDVGLTVGGKFGPVFGHRRIKIQIAPVGQHQGHQEGHGLGGGIDIDDGVLFPGAGLGLIGKAAPKVDNGLAVQGRGKARADVRTIVEIFLKGCSYAREPIARQAICHNPAHLRLFLKGHPFAGLWLEKIREYF